MVIQGETGDVRVIRTFYTNQTTPASGIRIWCASRESGIYEEVPQRIANLDATHVDVEVGGPNP